MPSLRPAILLVAAAVWLRWSAAGALAQNGSTATTCLCTGPQCFPPCPTTTPQFPFCPPRPPPSGVPFPWEAAPPRNEFIPQDPGFLAAAAAWRGWTAGSAWVTVVVVCSAFLLLLR